MKRLFTLLTHCILLFFSACSPNIIDLTEPNDSAAVVDGWVLKSDATGIPSIAKSVQSSDFNVTVCFIGDRLALNDILTGNWNITVGIPNQEPIEFSRKKNNVAVQTKDVRGATFSVTIEPRNASSRMTGISGNLATGSWMAMERDWIWWGMSAWTRPATGNVDLYLDRKVQGAWQRVAMSKNPGQDQDTIADNPG